MRQISRKNQKMNNMKHYLIALALMLTLSASTMSAAPKHRHHQQTTAVVKADTAKSQGVVAYSDTTQSQPQEAQDTVVEEDAHNSHNPSWNPSDYDDPFSYFGENFGRSVGGGILVALIIGVIFLFLLLPLIVVILVLRYLIKRHNDRVTLAEKAMESGQPIPESMKPVDKQTDDYLWKKGIRNTAIGIGLVIMFSIWESTGLAGVGALVACYGIGQLVIAKTSPKNTDKDDKLDNDEK
jgi:hypothetical protein